MNKPLRLKSDKKAKGFTIVELLVVIVVIGILAAITIVTYAGISQKAIVVSLQSDLASAQTQLKLFQVDNTFYPNSVTDCPTPSVGDVCLKPSSGNTYSSYSVNNSTNPQTFSLSEIHGGTIYTITNNTLPTTLASAPLSPVADWLATMQGDHYGNYFDLVSKQYAIVSRAGAKTIYDPLTSHIYDVPANYLGVNPRSDGKTGSEAVIEEGRTNYLTNTYGANNSSNKWTGWTYSSPVGTPTYSLTKGVYSTTAQRTQYTGIGGDSNSAFVMWQTSAVGSYSAGDTATASFYVKASLSGCNFYATMDAFTSTGTHIAGIGTYPGVSSSFSQLNFSYSNLPAGTSYIQFQVGVYGINSGSTVDTTVDAVQLEKGTFATSYIPTTGAAVARNADNVTIPTTGWSSSNGVVGIVAGDSPYRSSTTTIGRTWYWNGSGGYLSGYSGYSSELYMTTYTPGGGTAFGTLVNATTGYHTRLGRWNVGSIVRSFVDNIPDTRTDTYSVAVTGMDNIASIGGYGSNYYCGGIQRLVVYSSALSDSDVATVTSAIQNGP